MLRPDRLRHRRPLDSRVANANRRLSTRRHQLPLARRLRRTPRCFGLLQPRSRLGELNRSSQRLFVLRELVVQARELLLGFCEIRVARTAFRRQRIRPLDLAEFIPQVSKRVPALNLTQLLFELALTDNRDSASVLGELTQALLRLAYVAPPLGGRLHHRCVGTLAECHGDAELQRPAYRPVVSPLTDSCSRCLEERIAGGVAPLNGTSLIENVRDHTVAAD